MSVRELTVGKRSVEFLEPQTTVDAEFEQARVSLTSIAPFSKWSDVHFTRLGGMTNRSYRVDGSDSVVLRLPGAGTADFIDRRAESFAALAAAGLGVSPRVLHTDPDTGLLVTAFVSDAVTLTPRSLAERPGAIGRAAAVLRTLHQSGARFVAEFNAFGMIDRYLGVLKRGGYGLPKDYRDTIRATGDIRAALAGLNVATVACHCDPVCENLLDLGDRMLLIDWEYSGMNDPMWDLADLGVEASLDSAQRSDLFENYFQRAPGPDELARIAMYEAACDLLWALWALIGDMNQRVDLDYLAYGQGRLDRCANLIASADFARHLAALLAVRSRPRGN